MLRLLFPVHVCDSFAAGRPVPVQCIAFARGGSLRLAAIAIVCVCCAVVEFQVGKVYKLFIQTVQSLVFLLHHKAHHY